MSALLYNSDECKKLYERIFSSAESDFYKNIFEKAGLDQKYLAHDSSYDSFSRIPIISREVLASQPVQSRLYVKQADVRFYAHTSGTTTGVPMITPFADVESYKFDPTFGYDISKILIVYPPLNGAFGGTFVQQCRESDKKPSLIFGDVRNLSNSAVLAAEIGIDAIYATPTIAIAFGDALTKRFDTRNVKAVFLGSETLTSMQRSKLSQLYPDAKIVNLYASSEIGQFALAPCSHGVSQGENIFHPFEGVFAALEIVDGELVVTYANNPASPLFRYATGDSFEHVQDCGCGRQDGLRWSYRDGVDRIRIAGFEITVDAVESALSTIPDISNREYRIECDQLGEGLIALDFIFASDEGGNMPLQTSAPELIARDISHVLKVGLGKTLHDLVQNGMVHMPRVLFVDSIPSHGVKKRRLFYKNK